MQFQKAESEKIGYFQYYLINCTYEHTTTKTITGGALLYIEKDLNYNIRKDLLIYKSKQLEYLFIEIANKIGKNSVVGSI